MLKGRGGCGWVSGLLRLVMGLVEIGVHGSLGLVEIGALPLPSLPGKAEILLSNLLAPPLRIAKGLPHPKSLSYIGNLGELPIVIIAPSKFPNGKSLRSLSQSLTRRRTISRAPLRFCVGSLGLVEIGMGPVLLGFWFSIVMLGTILFYLFIYNMGFCFGGQWWRGGHGGGAMVVTGQWRCSDRG